MVASSLSLVTDKLRLTFREFSGIPPHPSVLVAFSGGSDSALLLSLLSELEDLSVAAAHLHHGIRGEEADRDEAFCRRFCEERGIRLYVGHADVPALAAEQHGGLEETARKERYAFLQAIATEHHYDTIATAHNADDNLETILFHLTRGTGLDGLTGIAPQRGNIIRPLLLCRKDEIEAACREGGIPFVTDSTNTDTYYTRNFIRAEIVPRLKSLNPSVVDAASETARLLRLDRAYWDEQTDRYSLSDGRRALAALDRALLSRVLRRALLSHGSSPTAAHIESIMQAMQDSSPHRKISLPHATFVCDRDCLRIEVPKESRHPHTDYHIPLHLGVNPLPNGSLIYLGNTEESDGEIKRLINIYKFAIQATLDSATIEHGLVARSRHPGDCYRLHGMTRRVKKMLQESKEPLFIRQALPLLTAMDDTVLWIPGFLPADGAAPRNGRPTITVLFCDHTKGFFS